MILTIVALAVSFGERRVWFGGTTFQFGRFLSEIEMPNVVAEVAFSPIIPRMVFNLDGSWPIPPLPKDYYQLETKNAVRLLKGSCYSPLMLQIENRKEKFGWAEFKSQILGKADGNVLRVQGGYTLSELMALGARKLQFPSTLVEKSAFYVNIKRIGAEGVEEVAAELGDHDIVKSGDTVKLVPRVARIKEKYMRTLDEYAGDGNEFYEQIRRVDREVLRSLDISSWRDLLTGATRQLDIDLAGTKWEQAYAKVFEGRLKLPGAKDHQTLQDFFAPNRLPGFHVLIASNMDLGHWIATEENGKRVRHNF
ncbi:MAG: hypothetical protein CBB60_001060 [Armatimonadetes bacterium Cent15-Ar3]|nr:MAG: hypothetical protein CBB60_001060 [Armatimonadetes bacterium Cent15-Ar3]